MQRFALIGAGFIGAVHASNLARHPDVDLVMLTDIDEARAHKIADKYHTQVGSIDAAFGDGIDAVLIASSTNTHADYVERAAAAGKAVYCEKPIDLSLSRVEKAAQKVLASNIPFMIGFNRRFDESHAALHAALSQNAIGGAELFLMTNRGPSLPPLEYIKVSGGQMRDQTIHFFDLLCWLSNDEPESVYALGAALADPSIKDIDVDTSLVSLRMRKGALAQIDSARRIGYGYDERIEVMGEKGLLESTRQSYRHLRQYSGQHIIEDGMFAGWFERIERSYWHALDAFVRSLNGEKLTLPSIEDGIRAQRIAEAAALSLKNATMQKIFNEEVALSL